jgi:MFS family permease
VPGSVLYFIGVPIVYTGGVSNRIASIATQVFASSPLRHASFRNFYLGSVGAALGYATQTTVVAWLMATLTPSALMVALVQTASTAPSLLLGLFAGSLADLIDRRRLILVTQVMLFTATAVLGAITLADAVTPSLLLLFTFLIGACFTFYMPAQSATINDLVARADVPRAVALGAVAFNVARAVGPALAGAMVAALSSGSALLASAVFFLTMILTRKGWKSPTRPPRAMPETLLSGIESGLRFTRHSPPMRALIVHNISFALCASIVLALLPVIARDQLQLGAGGFGLLSASFGIGAVVSALLVPRGLHRAPLNAVVTAFVLIWIAGALLIASGEHRVVAIAGAFCTGAAWTGVFSSLSAGTQTSAPAWVRARSVAMNLIAVQAAMAVGSAFWGWLAALTGPRMAMAAAAGTMLLLLGINRRVRVKMGDEADVTPSMHLPDLALATEPLPDDGPVLIQIEYRIGAENVDRFLAAIHKAEFIRRRNGASDWRIFRDLGEDGRFVERFLIRSWGEYVRLRTRLTISDRDLQEEVEGLQQPGVPVRVSRLIAT